MRLFKSWKKAASDLKNIQRELTVAFGVVDIDFMQLHPVIHRSILKDANARGVEVAVETFINALAAMDENTSATDEEKARVLLEVYREHGDQF